MSELHDALKKKYLMQKSEKPTVHKVGGSLTKSQLVKLIEQMGDDDEVFLQADWPDGMSQPVQKCIYVLQAFRRYKRDDEHPDYGERNIGWYSTLDAAIENLHANKDVIAETMPGEDGVDYPYYKYVLIEKVPEGPYACGLENEDDAVKFFEWKDGDYVEMERPKELEGVVGFTIG